jgi:hypothetical protein
MLVGTNTNIKLNAMTRVCRASHAHRADADSRSVIEIGIN